MNKLQLHNKNTLCLASFLMALAIVFGAFGAHALKDSLSQKALETYQIGVHYHLIHAVALLCLGILENMLTTHKLRFVKYALIIGIFLFSFNCYLYAITGIKTFAMIVPFGGTLWLIAWLKLAWDLRKI